MNKEKGPNLPLILNLIREDESFYQSVLSSFPKIEKSLKGFKDNPRCQCRNKIIKHFNSGSEDAQKFLEGWEETHKEINKKQSPPKRKNTSSDGPPRSPQNRGVKNVAGDVVEIPGEPQAFKDLMTHARKERWRYKTFTVMKDEKEDNSVWLVFFG